ncbi:TPA: MFS transporter [Raoultella planticola]|nr:MFS transporter [Klebsiella pneumoniae]
MRNTTASIDSSAPVRWYRDISWPQWKVLIAAWGVWVFDAVDFLAITFVLNDIAKEFNVSLEMSSLLLFVTYAVRWLGGLLFGSWSDRVGRKIPLLIVLTWFTAGAVLTGLSWNFTALIVFRLLLGFGMAPGFSLSATMVAESWPEKYRAIGIGILDTGWGLGAIGAAVAYSFVYPAFGWRGMFFIGLIPAVLLGLFIVFFVPESEVWLRNKKHHSQQAIQVKEYPAVRLFKEYPGRVGYLALLMLVLCFGSWPFQGLFPTYLKGLSFAPGHITLLTMSSAIGQVLGFFASGFIAEKYGRRLALGLMIGIGVLFVIALVYSVHILAAGMFCAFFAGFFLVGSSGIWGTILTENLPTEVRATGVGFLYNIGVIGGGIAPYIVLSTIHKVNMTVAFGIASFSAVAALLAFILLKFVKETKGEQINND